MIKELLLKETWQRVIDMEKIGSRKDPEKERLYTGQLLDENRTPIKINTIRIVVLLLIVTIIAVDASCSIFNIALFLIGLLIILLPNIMVSLLNHEH